MSTRWKNTLVLVAAFALAAAGLYVLRRAQRGRLSAIDAVPADAFLVMTLDIARLRGSPLGEPLFGGATSRLVGERTLTELCGFDPLARMTEVAVAVPEGGEPGEFGIAIVADVSRDELIACAKKVIESRHPEKAAAAEVRSSGSYTLVGLDDANAPLARRYPTLAYRDGGPFLIARGTWLGTMIDTVEGRLPSARGEKEHASLRAALGQGDHHPTFLATAILPKSLREKVKGDMGVELADGGVGTGTMAGVLGVASAGIGILAAPAGGDSEATAELRCEDAPGCAEVERFLGKKRLEWSQDLTFRLLGMGPLLDQAKIENRGTVVRVSTRAPSEDAARWLDRVLNAKAGRHPTALPKVPASATGPDPDETLRPAHP